MKKRTAVLMTWVLTAAFVFSTSMPTFAAATGSGDAAGAEFAMTQSGGGPGGPGGGAPMGDGVPSEAAIYFTDGAEDVGCEYIAEAYADYVTVADGVITIKDLDMKDGDYTFNGIIATGEQTVIRLENCTIYLSVDSPAASSDTGGSATGIGGGGIMYISNCTFTVDGAARYVTSAYDNSTLVVNDSTIESTGNNENTSEISAPRSNGALLISGNARANFSIGATQTYYYNSSCIAEGWAALSTDSATGTGLDLYAYNTKGIARNGGYGTYADTNCRVWLYGSDLEAAEIGVIISKTGQLVADSGENTPAEVLQYNEGDTTTAASRIAGGRNAVMMHAPDMMGSGKGAASTAVLTVSNSEIVTTKDLVSTEDYYATYGDAIGAYVDYVSGADLLVRSTSATITLENDTMETYSGVLLMTVLNADSMGNFLAEGDGAEVDPIALSMKDMEVEGDILHMDYQRRMTVDLTDTTLTGDVISGTFEEWTNLWAEYGEDASNWQPDESWETDYGVALTLNGSSVWKVEGTSTLSSLTVNDSASIEGTVSIDGETVTVETSKTYTGNIVVTGENVTIATSSSATKVPTFFIVGGVIILIAIIAAVIIVKKKK